MKQPGGISLKVIWGSSVNAVILSCMGLKKKGPTNDRVASGGVMLDWSIDP